MQFKEKITIFSHNIFIALKDIRFELVDALLIVAQIFFNLCKCHDPSLVKYCEILSNCDSILMEKSFRIC